jgi:hypothetical protein
LAMVLLKVICQICYDLVGNAPHAPHAPQHELSN